MEEGDGDTWYCYYAVMKLQWKPHEFAFLSPQEKALMYVFIDEKVRSEEKERKKIQSSAKRKGGRR